MKKILKTLKRKWAEYLLEMLVIVIGILGAFLLNNWNEDRKSEVIKKQLLESMITEFEYNLTALDSASVFDKVARTNIIKLLGKMNSENTDSIDYILGLSLFNWTFDPTNGALKSAKTSGVIHLIQDKVLLAKLFSWEDLIKDLNEEQHRFRDEQWDAMEKFTENHRLGNALNQVIDIYPKSKFDYHNSVLKNPNFESNLLKRLLIVNAMMKEMRHVRKVNEEILTLLRNELQQ